MLKKTQYIGVTKFGLNLNYGANLLSVIKYERACLSISHLARGNVIVKGNGVYHKSTPSFSSYWKNDYVQLNAGKIYILLIILYTYYHM